MLIVPIQAAPNQTLTVLLANQNVQVNIYTKSTGMFVDVLVSGVAVCTAVLALNLNMIVRASYGGFIGDFTFVDTQGTSDPTYDGLGSRYLLIYLEASDL